MRFMNKIYALFALILVIVFVFYIGKCISNIGNRHTVVIHSIDDLCIDKRVLKKGKSPRIKRLHLILQTLEERGAVTIVINKEKKKR